MESLPSGVRYGHTNLVSRDWRALSRFYRQVFGCSVVPSERDLHGAWLDQGTGLPNAHVQGVHLRLPGHGPDGPTLEIFSYDAFIEGVAPPPNRTGYGHIAFQVADVHATVAAVLSSGGSAVGEIVDATIPGAGPIRWAYVRDPEGNIIELQRWRPDDSG